MTVYELREEEPREVASIEPWVEELERLLPGAIDVRRSRMGAIEVTARRVVGVVPVGADRVYIEPKVPIARLLELIEVAYDVPSLRLFDVSTDCSNVAGLFRVLARRLVRLVGRRLHRGIHRVYVEHDEVINVVRGRLDVRRTQQLLDRGVVAAACAFDDLTADVPENRIIRWCLERLRRCVELGAELRRDIAHQSRLLAGEVELTQFMPDECVVEYDPMTEDYRPIHALCALLLRALGPQPQAGATSAPSFTVSMPDLFERYIARTLRSCAPLEIVIETQRRIPVAPACGLEFRADFVVRGETGTLAVLDAKYKRHATPSVDDVQQVIAYAAALGTRHAVLLYPSAATEPIRAKVGEIELASAVVDLDAPAEQHLRTARQLLGCVLS